MAVFRINKTKDYVVMSKYHLKEKRMSLKAKGLLSEMLSLPDDWDYSVMGLSEINAESRNCINSILNELEDFGYLKRSRNYVNGKIDSWTYDIYEKPLYLKNEDIENEDIENLDIENNTQLNNKEINNKELSNKQYKEKAKKKYFDNEELNELFLDFIAIRKKLKAVNSDRAINNLLKTLEPFPDDIKKQMINKSITNSWKGVFPLKQQKKERKSIFEL